jgi:deoxyribonucleoside regulator
MNDISEERVELLAQVANLYFEHGRNQNEIADQLQISRSSVSRLLAEARELGIVEIRINFPLARDVALEEAIAQRFDLNAVYVLNTKNIVQTHILGRLGRLASSHLQGRITDDTTIALSWGTAVFETVQAMRRRQASDVKVVQVIGAAGSSNPLIDGPDLARQLAERLGGQYHYLHAPLIVENSYVRETLLSDIRVKRTLEMARLAQVALVGIGTITPEVSPLVRAGYLTEEEAIGVMEAGAVGDFCGYHIDIQGNVLDIPLNHRVLGISVEDIRSIPHIVGVAGGIVKAPTILGVLRKKLVDVLVTDDHAAREVLRRSE